MLEGLALSICLCQRKTISLSGHASSSGKNEIKIKKLPPSLCAVTLTGLGSPNPTPAPLQGAWTMVPWGEAAPQEKSCRGYSLGESKISPASARGCARGTLHSPNSLSSTRLNPGRPRQCLHPPGGCTSTHICARFSAWTSPACAKALQIYHRCLFHISSNKKIQTAIPYFYEQMALDG